jgi:hypothetical protein
MGRVCRAVDQKSIYSITTREREKRGPLINRQKHKRSSFLRPSSSSSYSSPPPFKPQNAKSLWQHCPIVPGTFHTLNNGPTAGRHHHHQRRWVNTQPFSSVSDHYNGSRFFFFFQPPATCVQVHKPGPSAHVIIKMLEKKGEGVEWEMVKAGKHSLTWMKKS